MCKEISFWLSVAVILGSLGCLNSIFTMRRATNSSVIGLEPFYRLEDSIKKMNPSLGLPVSLDVHI